jgi:dTDP-4-amino-4,6-dideoxygalactose transaminase
MSISLYKTFYPKGLGKRLQKVFDSGMTSEGPEAAAFQKELQEWAGNPYIALTSSGTAALDIAGRLAGVGPGDEVISSPVTCLAGNGWILHLGAKPIWCDIKQETGCIDENKIEALITEKTKAITFVDWGGIPAELEKIQKIADKYNLKTIEDGAQSMGAKFNGRKITENQICDYITHSFQSIKILSTADGGCISCKTKEDFDRAILLRWFGLARGQNSHAVCWIGDVYEPGYKAHMNDVNAAIGREQLKTVDQRIAKHKKNAAYLLKHLKQFKSKLSIPEVSDYIDPLYWVLTIRFENALERARISDMLTKAGIGNNISHVRNDKYSLFKNYQKTLPEVDNYEERRLNIPCGWWIKKKELDYIIQTLKKIL